LTPQLGQPLSLLRGRAEDGLRASSPWSGQKQLAHPENASFQLPSATVKLS